MTRQAVNMSHGLVIEYPVSTGLAHLSGRLCSGCIGFPQVPVIRQQLQVYLAMLGSF